MNIAQGRLDYGPPVAVIDIGSNSVRLVVYEGLTRSPTPIFNEKVLAGPRTRGADHRPAGRRCGREGARGAAALSRAVRPHGRHAAVGDRDRRLPRRQERQGLRRRGRAHLRHQDRRSLRQARGGIVRARRGVRLPQARRHRRRSRRRLARTDRGPGATDQGRLDACRSADSRCRTFRRSRSRRRKRSSGRRSTMRACSRAARAAPSMPSAAPGARWRGCTCGRPAIRSTSCTAM